MVFIQALANDLGPASACLQLARDGKIALCVSPAILAEVAEVLARPKLRKKLPSLTAGRITAFLEDVANFAELFLDVPSQFRYDRDPKDEPYINLAIFVNARYLTSRDRDLLDLSEDDTFRLRFPDLLILDPVTFLREVASATDQAG
jgi:uncharacterized protein